MPQELSTKMMETLPAGQVRPYDKKTVYATGAGGFHAEGEELELHPLLADKLVSQGAATADVPKAKVKKEDK